MSSTLEQYIQDRAEEYVDSLKGKISPEEVDFAVGANSIIALDLPVKFAEYKDRNFVSTRMKDPFKQKYWKNKVTGELNTYKGIYKYWIKNIYKPE